MARRATSLGPKPSLFVLVFLGFFWFFGFLYKKPCFPHRKGHFLFIFSVSLSFSLSLFLTSLFFCFSFPVSLFSSFLSLFLLVFVFCFLLVPCLGLFLYSSFFFGFFHERNNIKIFNCKFFFFINIFSFLVSCLFVCFKFLFLIFALS